MAEGRHRPAPAPAGDPGSAALAAGAPCLGYLLREVSTWISGARAAGCAGPAHRPLAERPETRRPGERAGRPSDPHPRPRPGAPHPQAPPMGLLRQAVTVTPGQRIGYCAISATRRRTARPSRLAREADLLFLESARRGRRPGRPARPTTTRAAGEIARAGSASWSLSTSPPAMPAGGVCWPRPPRPSAAPSPRRDAGKATALPGVAIPARPYRCP